MANLKVTELAAATTPAGADLLHIIANVATTPANKKITVSSLIKSYGLHASETTASISDYSYPYGDERRYVLTADDSTASIATSNATNLQIMINVCAAEKIPCVIGNYYYIDAELLITTSGFEFAGIGWSSGLEQVTDSTGVLRAQGDVPNATMINDVTVRDVCLSGMWTAANGWIKGDEPHTGTNETTDTEASPLEFIYVTDFKVLRVESRNSQYDGISIPKDCTHFEIAGCMIHDCQDDGINPGGLPSTGGNGVRRGFIHHNVIYYCSNTGIHLSASAVDVDPEDVMVVDSNIIFRCGDAGIDFSASGSRRHVITNNHIYHIGKPATADSEYAAYPGPLSTESFKFFDTGAPVEGCFGIYARGVGGEEMEHCLISGNTIADLFDRVDTVCTGIDVATPSDTTDDIVIENNVIDFRNRNVTDYPSNSFRGIVVGDKTAIDSTYTNIIIKNNTIYGNKGLQSDTGSSWGRSIQLAAGDGCEVTGNYLSRVGEAQGTPAIQIWCDKAKIANNVLENCYGGGITLSASDFCTVQDNTIMQSGDITATFLGISNTSTSTECTIKGNYLQDSYILWTGNNPIISDNTVVVTGDAYMSNPIGCSGTDAVINNNTVRILSSGADPSTWMTAAISFSGNGSMVTNNNIHRVDTTGAAVIGVFATSAADDSLVSGNTIYTEGRGIAMTTASDRVQITNNTISTNLASGNDIDLNVLDSLVSGNTIYRRGAGTTVAIDNSSTSGDNIITNNIGSCNGALMVNSGGDDIQCGNVESGSPTRSFGNDATPSVEGDTQFWTSTLTTAVTDFDNGYTGQVITILAESTKTITDGTNILLNGSANFDMVSGDSLTLVCKADGKWYELSRTTDATAQTYTETNVSTDRAFDANAAVAGTGVDVADAGPTNVALLSDHDALVAVVQELSDVVGTLIVDLRAKGMVK